MADAKIINYGQQISAGTTAIPDNTTLALDISSTDSKDYIQIKTSDTGEELLLTGGGSGLRIGGDGRVKGSASNTFALLPEDATATNPNIIPYADDLDTGIGRAAADQLSLIAGGEEVLRCLSTNGNAELLLPVETGFIGDPDTMMRSLGANQIEFRCAGTDVLRIGPSGAFIENGNFGVGTLTPSTKFECNGAATTIGAIATELTGKMGTGGSSSTTVTGGTGDDATNFGVQLHVGSAIKLGSDLRTVTAIDSSSTPQTLTVDTAVTAATGSTGYYDSGELFAVKTGDSKTLFSVQPTGAIGAGANAGTTTGVYNNLGIGDPTMFDKLTTGNALFVMGNQSGDYDFTTANALVAIGYNACAASTASQNLVAIGTYAADTDTDIRESVIIGSGAGRSSGNDSVHIGHAAGAGSTGTANVSIGRDALATSGASASHVAIGKSSAGKVNAAATGCVSIGHTANGEVTSGVKNTAVGYFANGVTTTGTFCTIIGAESYPSANNTTNEVVLGASAVGQGANTVMLGSSAIDGLHCYEESITSPSDLRVKDNVQDSSLGLDFINALRPVKYEKKHPSDFPEEIREARWSDREVTRTRTNDDNETEEYTETIPADTKPADWQARTEYGLIAQEVKAAMEAQGGADWHGHTVLPSGMEALGYGKLVTVLVKAVQELTARIATLEAGD